MSFLFAIIFSVSFPSYAMQEEENNKSIISAKLTSGEISCVKRDGNYIYGSRVDGFSFLVNDPTFSVIANFFGGISKGILSLGNYTTEE